MSAYGQALVLLALDALKDRRGDQLAKTLVGSVQLLSLVLSADVPSAA